MGEILRKTVELLVWSFWSGWVPFVVGVWNWVIVGAGWLVIGGLVSVPLIIEGARALHRRFKSWPARVVIWIVGLPAALWLYACLWVASAMWFDVHMLGTQQATTAVRSTLGAFWVVGFCLWLVEWR